MKPEHLFVLSHSVYYTSYADLPLVCLGTYHQSLPILLATDCSSICVAEHGNKRSGQQH